MEERQMKIILLSEDQITIGLLEKFFSKQSQMNCAMDVCPLKTSTEEILLRYTPDLIFIDLATLLTPDQDMILGKFERVSSFIPLVGLFHESQKDQTVEFVRKGIRDLVPSPPQEQEIMRVIHRFHKTSNTPQLKIKGRAYTFFSFKGGVGNSFITLNTAISLARSTKKKVLLWDMALQAGDIPFFLDFKPEYSVADLVDNIEHIDQSYLEGLLAPHPSGVSILPAPVRIEDIERLTPSVMEQVINRLVLHFDHVFIDGGYRLTDSLIPLIDYSAYLFITSTLELISLRSAARCLDILERLNYSPEKIKIVINRYSSKFEAINIDKAREILKFNLVQFISNDYATASQSVNEGRAVIDVAKGSNIAKQFLEFAAKIDANFNETQKNKKIFGKFVKDLKKATTDVHH